MTKASSELHRTQPALSAQLAKLEEELGESLFDRTPKGMELTDAGEVFLTYAEQAVARLDDGIAALTKFRGLEHGSLTVGGGVTATTYLLPPILGAFNVRYPSIRLFVREEASAEVVEDVLKGTLDIGIVTLPSKVADHKNVHVEPWVQDELVLLVPPGHALNEAEAFVWKDLANIPLVLFEAGSTLRAQIDAKIAQANIAAEVVMELRSVEAIKQMVMEGIGAAFVSQHCLYGDAPRAIKCADGYVGRTLGIIYRTDLAMNPAATAFLDFMMAENLDTLISEYEQQKSEERKERKLYGVLAATSSEEE